MQFKPDTLNGQRIFREIERGPDGINHQGRMIVFPPTIRVGPVPVLPLEELVHDFLKGLVLASPNPAVQAQLEQFKGELGKRLLNFARRVEAQSRG